MIVVFLTLNGIGLGHLSRAFALAEDMQTSGDSPVIFAQGCYPDFMLPRVPGLSVGVVYRMSAAERLSFASGFTSYVRMAGNPVVVEDTHPAPIVMPPDLSRYLLVRPTNFDYLRKLQSQYGSSYRGFLICDDAASPTWPFSKAETQEIASWRDWTAVGPVVRRATDEQCLHVRRKYGIERDDKVFVFSMGGGGVQDSAREERPAFLERCQVIGESIRRAHPRGRLLFVRGPLFPASQSVPSLFEEIAVEPEMPSLLALASGAVVRPGYNTTWECLLGNTPMLAINGTTFEEPVSERLKRMEDLGLLAANVEQLLDAGWLSGFHATCSEIASRWSPAQSALRMREHLAACQPEPRTTTTLLLPEETPLARGMKANASDAPLLLVRIDDVIRVDQDLMTALEFCSAYGLPVSLEVVPYLCQTDEEELDRLIGGRLQYEVSQHGYAHLPRRDQEGRKAEYTGELNDVDTLARGIAIMRRKFPNRFRGGFSAPYDSAPVRIYEDWYGIGGRYASVSQDRLRPWPPRVVRLGVEPWNWLMNAPYSEDELVAEAALSLRERGSAGLVIHSCLLRNRALLRQLESLASELLHRGCRPALVSDAAMGISSQE